MPKNINKHREEIHTQIKFAIIVLQIHCCSFSVERRSVEVGAMILLIGPRPWRSDQINYMRVGGGSRTSQKKLKTNVRK